MTGESIPGLNLLDPSDDKSPHYPVEFTDPATGAQYEAPYRFADRRSAQTFVNSMNRRDAAYAAHIVEAPWMALIDELRAERAAGE